MDDQKHKIIKDYLLGRATEKEIEKLAGWMSLSEDFRKRFFRSEMAYYLGRYIHQDQNANTRVAEEKFFKKSRNWNMTPNA